MSPKLLPALVLMGIPTLAGRALRNSIYTKQFPTGTWLEVKGLALPEFMIEIELEAHRSE